MRIAVILTCHNRKQKTKDCLQSFHSAISNIRNVSFEIYLTDDNSNDGTSEMVGKEYPQINRIKGSGNLYWAGGMRLAWTAAIESGINYDGFLLINDDVVFDVHFWEKIGKTMQYVEKSFNQKGIYVLSTKDNVSGRFSYGGHKLRNKVFKHSFYHIEPDDNPQECQLVNANILYVSCEVVNCIGILDSHFTHSIADFDYSLTAWERKIPVFVCPGYGGYCIDDHTNVLDSSLPLFDRIHNLYATKGLALNEYLYYLRKHFKGKAIYAFFVLWMNALFPKLMKK
jgi:GT2 family glycosyltransferase